MKLSAYFCGVSRKLLFKHELIWKILSKYNFGGQQIEGQIMYVFFSDEAQSQKVMKL